MPSPPRPRGAFAAHDDVGRCLHYGSPEARPRAAADRQEDAAAAHVLDAVLLDEQPSKRPPPVTSPWMPPLPKPSFARSPSTSCTYWVAHRQTAHEPSVGECTHRGAPPVRRWSPRVADDGEARVAQQHRVLGRRVDAAVHRAVRADRTGFARCLPRSVRGPAHGAAAEQQTVAGSERGRVRGGEVVPRCRRAVAGRSSRCSRRSAWWRPASTRRRRARGRASRRTASGCGRRAGIPSDYRCRADGVQTGKCRRPARHAELWLTSRPGCSYVASRMDARGNGSLAGRLCSRERCCASQSCSW